MKYTIDLPEELERLLREQALAAGQTVEAFTAMIVNRELETKSFEETPIVIQQQVVENEMTEEEMDEIIEEVREEIWREQHGYPSKVR